jgi:hypothetical protein
MPPILHQRPLPAIPPPITSYFLDTLRFLPTTMAPAAFTSAVYGGVIKKDPERFHRPSTLSSTDADALVT